jgi:hypothetical protein
MQGDMQNTSPVTVGKRFNFQIGVLPTLVPTGMANLSVKVKVYSEGELSSYMPQIDFFCGYWNMVWTRLAVNNSHGVKNADFSGYWYGLLASTTVSPKTRLFGGVSYSMLNANLELTETKEVLGARVNSFDSGFGDKFFILAIEQLIKPDRWFIAQLNYGIEQNFIFSKISWYGKYLELGINIYPEGVLVIHPVLNFHISF